MYDNNTHGERIKIGKIESYMLVYHIKYINEVCDGNIRVAWRYIRWYSLVRKKLCNLKNENLRKNFFLIRAHKTGKFSLQHSISKRSW